MELIKHSNSPLWTLIKIWKGYLEFEIRNTEEDVDVLLGKEIKVFV
jgi:hypothetical protein